MSGTLFLTLTWFQDLVSDNEESPKGADDAEDMEEDMSAKKTVKTIKKVVLKKKSSAEHAGDEAKDAGKADDEEEQEEDQRVDADEVEEEEEVGNERCDGEPKMQVSISTSMSYFLVFGLFFIGIFQSQNCR